MAHNAYAELKSMTTKELKSETGQAGLTEFTTLGDTTARLFTDIHLETWTDISSAKIGNYTRSESTRMWDQNWTDIKIGTETTPLQMDGFVFKADFDNLNIDNPSLKRIVIGTNRLVGTVEANLQSFTGYYNPALTADSNDPSGPVIREQLGTKEFNFTADGDKYNDQGFFIVITPDTNADHPGIQIIAGYNELNITTSLADQSPWWDK